MTSLRSPDASHGPATFRRVWNQRLFGSVRAKTTLFATVVVGAALSLGSLGLVQLLSHELVTNLAATATNESVNLVDLIYQGELPNPIPIQRGDVASQVVDAQGKVVAFTQNLAKAPAQYHLTKAMTKITKPVVLQQQNTVINGLGDFDSNYVLVVNKVTVAGAFILGVNRAQIQHGVTTTTSAKPAAPVVIAGPGIYYVYVWASLGSVDQSSRSLRNSLLLGLPFLILIVGLSTWYAARRAFEPVEQMRIDLDEITETNLSRRIYESDLGDEIGRLAHTMNQMLERLEMSVEERKRFVADASHELKSPLSALRTSLEIAIRHPDSADWQATARTSLAESQRMQHIIEDLILLAKADSGQLALDFGTVDLDDLIFEESSRLRQLVDVKLDLSEMSAGRVEGDIEKLRSVVRNLLENAARHAVSEVAVTLMSDQKRVTMEIIDDGIGIPVEEREAIFERFYRMDESRSRDRGGSGLGLAIVRSIVYAHGGIVLVEDSDRGSRGARFVVILPVEPEGKMESQTMPTRAPNRVGS